MTEKEKRQLEERRKEAALKNMYYTRYFSVRYATAFFFFVNLYWTLMLYLSNTHLVLFLPLGTALVSALAMWEQSRMFTVHQRVAKYTRFFYYFSVLLNALLIILVFVGQYHIFFPFFSVSSTTVVFLITSLLGGMLLSLLMLAKLNRIHHNADKQYQRIQKYIASIQH